MWTVYRKVAVFGLVLGSFAPGYARADMGSLEPAKLTAKIKEQIAKLKVSANTNLFNQQIFDGVATAVKYRYDAEPSYMDNYYTRYDQYDVEADVNPAAWVEDLQSPFGLGFSAGSEIVFARQFKSQLESLTAVPYTLVHLPVTADRAQKELQVGDFVSFQTKLSLMASVGASIPLYSFITASGSTHAILSGTFMVHFFKVSDTKVRLKFIAIRDTGVGADAGVNIGGFKITGVNIVDHRIESWVHLDPAGVSKSDDFSDLFMIDYVLDLKDPRVAAAYDHVMLTKLRLNSAQLIDPLNNRNDLQNDLVTDLSEFETLFEQEKSKAPADRLVDRLFNGSAVTDTDASDFKIGLNLIRFENGTTFAENKVLNLDGKPARQRFLFDTFSSKIDKTFLFHLFDVTQNIGTNLLFTADDNYHPMRFVALALSREIMSKSLSKSDLASIRNNLKKVLPGSIYNQIQWKDWDYNLTDIVNIDFRHEIYFPIDALVAMPVLSSDELAVRYHEFLTKIPAPEAAPMEPPVDVYGKVKPPGLGRYDEDVQFVSSQLAQALNPNLDSMTRYQAFVALKNNLLFQETGAGFLIQLLPQDRLEQYLGYTMELSGKGGDKISFKYGLPSEDPLYKSLLYIESVLNNRSIDLRLLKAN